MSLKTLKIEKDLCRCCHAEGKFQNLAEPLLHLGRLEDHSQMMQSCLNVEISPVQGVLAASTYTICNECIQRLRDANNFRQQVFLCEERFKYMYCEFLNNQEVLKLESSSDHELKVEFLEDDDDRLDIQFDESDDEPVIHVKDEESKKTKSKPKTKSKAKSKKLAGVQNSLNEKKENYTTIKMDNEVNYSCNACSKTFRVLQNFRTHYKRVHLKIKRTLIFGCTLCRMKLRPQDRPLHMEEVHGVLRPQCNACGKIFTHNFKMLRHQREYHMGEKNYKCDACSFMTNTQNSLKRHSLVHSGLRPFSCEVCDKTFRWKKNLLTHEKTHYNIREFVCPICNADFIQNCNLKYHLAKRHPDCELLEIS